MQATRRAGRVQYDDVAAAARELLREGIRPTVRRVRAKTGGSPNDVTPLLATWFQRLSDGAGLEPAAPGPHPGSIWATHRPTGASEPPCPELLARAEQLLEAARHARQAAEATIVQLASRLEAAEQELARLRLHAIAAGRPAPARRGPSARPN